MNSKESRAAFSLSSIFCLRMLGLFMIYPVFAVYAGQLSGATPVTIGLALGAYGLAQALLQIPYGMLSDRAGRKRMVTIGLLLFALGSVIAALSGSIGGVIIGRVIQGTGAVGSVLLALNADLTRPESRTKAMAIVGMSIGLAFALAVVVGPILNSWIGVPGIFWLTAVLALLGIAVLHTTVPSPESASHHRDAQAVPALFKRVLKDTQLLRLDFGIFALHAMLTASFLALPEVLSDIGGLALHHQWMLYLPVMAASFIIMVPLIILAEARHKMKPVFLGGIVAMGLAQAALCAWHHSLGEFAVLLAIFFSGFNLMEAALPSLISKIAPADAKGTAMGMYSSAQFFGIFVGGAMGGWAYSLDGPSGVFLFAAAVALIWLLVAATMEAPRHVSSYLLKVHAENDHAAEKLTRRLQTVPGVVEAMVVREENVAYLKIDSKALDRDKLKDYSTQPVKA